MHDSYLEFAEIDIIEGISTSTHNELSIHTNNPSCTVGSGQASGQIIGVNQVVESNGNIAKSGVRVANAFGRAFNEHGGGTYAMQLEFGGISIWLSMRNISSKMMDSRMLQSGSTVDQGLATRQAG